MGDKTKSLALQDLQAKLREAGAVMESGDHDWDLVMVFPLPKQVRRP